MFKCQFLSHIKIPYDLKNKIKYNFKLSVASLEVCGGLHVVPSPMEEVESWEVGEWSKRTHNWVCFQTHPQLVCHCLKPIQEAISLTIIRKLFQACDPQTLTSPPLYCCTSLQFLGIWCFSLHRANSNIIPLWLTGKHRGINVRR